MGLFGRTHSALSVFSCSGFEPGFGLVFLHVHYVHYVHVHKVKAQKFLPPYPPPYRDRGFISLFWGKPVIDSLGVWLSKFYSRWTIRVPTRVFLRLTIAYSSRPQSRKKQLKITVFRQRRREKRSCGRCGYRIDLNRKTTRRIGTGEVHSELRGLGTTHASYVIRNLTKIAVFCTK